MRKLLFFALALAPVRARAQVDSARGEVFGTIYDSVARAPIGGANVQLVLAARASATPRTVLADANGGYRIPSLEPGRYLVTFQDAALDTLALESPTSLVDVRAGERIRVDLAVPSPRRIWSAVCRDTAPKDSTGLVLGMLRDARTRRLLDSGTVQAHWSEFIIDNAGMRQLERRVAAMVTNEGWFALCGVPAMEDLALLAIHGADTTGLLYATVPYRGVTRRDLYIGGRARVRGVVRADNERPLANARAGITSEIRVATSDTAGAFLLDGIAAGSQTMEVRALGYASERLTLMLQPDQDTTVHVRLTSLKHVMDTIKIVAQRLYDPALDGFDRRRRAGIGRYFDENDIRKRHPYDVFSLLSQMTWLQRGSGLSRQVTMRSRGSGCSPEIYLDGHPLPRDMLSDLDMMVQPEDIRGIEVYNSSASTPTQFSRMDSCGAIIIWTGPRRRPPK